MTVKSSNLPASESDIELSEYSSPSLVSASCNAAKLKWLAQIATDQQQISILMQKILTEESSNESSSFGSLLETPSSFAILDRLRTQQENAVLTISNLVLSSSLVTTVPRENEELELSSEQEKTTQLLLFLRTKGYESLANKLESCTEYPWNKIKKLWSPILIEQLVDIYSLCKHKEMSETDTEKMIHFSLSLANLADSSNSEREYDYSNKIIDDTKQILGQLIYLIDQDPSTAFRVIDSPDNQESLEAINTAFAIKIQEICERLQNHYFMHQTTQLQNPEVALHTRIPIEIGKAILTGIGTINTGIIDSLSHIFLSQENPLINHEVSLSHALTLLQRSPKLRSEFEKIRNPKSKHHPSNNVIRATLGLLPDEEIHLSETRLTALIAILSHIRQGSDRSCFAVSIAIEVSSSHLGSCFKDLRQLLEEGKLTRRIRGVKKDIPFIRRINDQNLRKEITFNSRGELIIPNQTNALLWEAPGILSACQAIGIQDPRTTLLHLIEKLPPLRERIFHKMEIKTLLAKICEESQPLDSPSSTFDRLYHQACFAFSSQTAQPLLKVWENAIANMAEAEEGSMIKTLILETSLDTLQFKLAQLAIPPSLLIQSFLLYTQKLLCESIRLQYDPTIGYSLEGNERTVEGGFVLYNKERKIEGQKDFCLFLDDILQNVNTLMREEISSDLELQNLKKIIDIFIPYLHSEAFLRRLLLRYHSSNKYAMSQTPLDYSHLQCTPWLMQTGNDSKALLKIYLESDKTIVSKKFILTGAEEALTKIIDMCKEMSDQEKEFYLTNPNKLKPLFISGKHRFPFMAGTHSLSNAWKEFSSTKTWIDHSVIDPGKEISGTLIDESIKQNLIEHLESMIPHDLPIEVKQSIFDRIHAIEEELTIQEYRNRMLAIFLEVQPVLKTPGEKLTRQIDTALCDSLTPELKKTLEHSAVHFADTNWSKDIQDLHFCFAVNPGTGELELWEVQSNGSHLTALDQHYWLINQKWEFLSLPEELIPDDSSFLDTH